MITTTTEKMLKNKDLRNGVLNSVIESLLGWVDEGTQGKIETNIFSLIEETINCNISEDFNKSQMYFITNNFRSCGDFLNNFYKANPEISIVVNGTLWGGVIPIILILDGRADKTYKPLCYYYGIFNNSLEVLKRLIK